MELGAWNWFKKMRFRVNTVRKLVEESFLRSRSVENPRHGITADLAMSNLVAPPISRRFYDGSEGHEKKRLRWLWEVWDERPGGNEGYLIVFDPRRGEFGLAARVRSVMGAYPSVEFG